MHGWSDAQYRAALDRLLKDCGEFLTRYAWTDYHDDAVPLYDRITEAREYIARVEAAPSQGAARGA